MIETLLNQSIPALLIELVAALMVLVIVFFVIVDTGSWALSKWRRRHVKAWGRFWK